MKQKTNLAVIIPCYNEEQNFDIFDAELALFVNQVTNTSEMRIHFFIVDNNSTDQSAALLGGLQKRYHGLVTVLNCPVQGYGAALKHGFSQARDFDYITFLDFDNTYPLMAILDLLKLAIERDLDLVYGVRLHAGSQIETIRKVGNRFYVLLLKLLCGYPLSDACSGQRVFKAEHISTICNLKENDLSFSIELTMCAINRKWSLAEKPIAYRGRTGESKLSVVSDGFKFLSIIIREFIKKMAS
jgi:glycosyltransferase involved in cell wall biosynthesis